MSKADRILWIFVLDFEFGQITADLVIKFELACLHKLEQRDCGHRLEGRAYQVDGVDGGRCFSPDIGVPVCPGPDNLLAGYERYCGRWDVPLGHYALDFGFQFLGDAVNVYGLGKRSRRVSEDQQQKNDKRQKMSPVH